MHAGKHLIFSEQPCAIATKICNTHTSESSIHLEGVNKEVEKKAERIKPPKDCCRCSRQKRFHSAQLKHRTPFLDTYRHLDLACRRHLPHSLHHFLGVQNSLKTLSFHFFFLIHIIPHFVLHIIHLY